MNPDTGRSYKYFTTNEQSLRDILEERIGIRVLLENDTRARCYDRVHVRINRRTRAT